MVSSVIISTNEISKGFDEHPLFSKLSLTVGERERLALIGNNGCGKSTLLKILAGLEEVDDGTVSVRKGLRCAYVPQREDFDPALSVREVIEQSLVAHRTNPEEVARRISLTLGAAGFSDGSVLVGSLSGGWRKRLAIAAALAVQPDCILLDEPTNHLDVDSILWLEEHLDQLRCAIVFVSHDRYFIERLASRIVELNTDYPRDCLVSDGGYADYIEYREQVLGQLQQQRRSLANKVRREVEWLRQGVKARTTKSRARINEAHKLIDTLKNTTLSDDKGPALEFAATQRKTKELLKAEAISQSMGERELFANVSLVLSPGSRLAVVGPNGSGKTTFIRTLLGFLPPTSGKIKRAPNVRVAFMDQARSQLTDEITLKEFLCPHGDSISFRGESIHVAAWAARFLFSRNQLATTLGSLSGGERARANLAKVMTEEVDILVFDEPTNDLDIVTLENLEDSFEAFPGAIVLITHDRYLLDRVAISVLGLRDGRAVFYGSYSQWEEARVEAVLASSVRKQTAKVSESSTATAVPTKLSYKDARELSMIEKDIEKAETVLESIQSQLDSGEYATNAVKLGELCAQLQTQQAEVERLYSRWQALETLKKSVTKS